MTRSDQLRDLEAEISVIIRRSRRLLGPRAREIHPELAPGSFLVLVTIARSEPIRASVLAELFAIDKGSMSRHVKHLGELGLVTSQVDPSDARALLLSFTREARVTINDLFDQRINEHREHLSDWGDTDLAPFIDALKRYNLAFDGLDRLI